jgi:hypothetical protein
MAISRGREAAVFRDSVQRRLEFLGEPCRHTRIAFCIPSRGILALCDGFWMKLKGFHDGYLRLRRFGAELPARKPA